VSQGWQLARAIKTLDAIFRPDRLRMAPSRSWRGVWKCEGGAARQSVIITKQASGTAKIDALALALTLWIS